MEIDYGVIYNSKFYGMSKLKFANLLKQGYYITQVCKGPEWCPRTYFYISKKENN